MDFHLKIWHLLTRGADRESMSQMIRRAFFIIALKRSSTGPVKLSGSVFEEIALMEDNS